MGRNQGPRDENDRLVTLYVEGELGIYESDIEDVGAEQAAQDELGHTGFVVHSAE